MVHLKAISVLRLPAWHYVPNYVVLTKDASALCALSTSLEGTTTYHAWNLRTGKTIASGGIPIQPIPHRGGCMAGDPSSASHPNVSRPSWDSPAAPVFLWDRGQQIDLQAKTQTAILSHPGWDALDSYAIVLGWSLSNLQINQLDSSDPVAISHWVEWNPRVPAGTGHNSLKRFVVWQEFNKRSAECVSPDGKWIAYASPADPDFSRQDIPSIISGLGPATRVRIWSTGTPLPLRTFDLASPARMIELSPHGAYLVVTGKEGRTTILDSRTGAFIGDLGDFTGRPYWGDDEEYVYTVHYQARTISRCRLNPFQVDTTYQLPAREGSYNNILVDADHSLAVAWSYLYRSDTEVDTSFHVFRLQEASDAPANPDAAGPGGQAPNRSKDQSPALP